MSSAEKIPDDLRAEITWEAQRYPLLKWDQIRELTREWIWKHRSSYSLPGESSFRKIVNAAKKDKSPLENPWSLGMSEAFDIPDDATADLMALLKRSIVGDTTFTIRQAIWAARLRGTISETPTKPRLKELRYWAGAYAADERVAHALEQPLDTRELDSSLAFHAQDGNFQWAGWVLASNLGAVPGISGTAAKDDALADALTTKVGAEQSRALRFDRGVEEDSEEVKEIRELIRSPTGIAEIDINQDREDISILLHRQLRITAKWKEGSAEDRGALVQQVAARSPELTRELLQD